MRATAMKSGPGDKSNRAFTLTELLVILAVLAVLACIHVSALSLSKDQTRIGQCSGNLRQIAMSMQLYGSDYNDKLPSAGSGGIWAWDLNWATGNLLNKYGTPWQKMFCPGTAVRYTQEDYFNLYNYAINTYHVTGYFWLLAGNSSIISSNLNASLVPQGNLVSGALGSITMPALPPSKRPLVTDATASDYGQYNYNARYSYNWTTILGGYTKPHITSHLFGQIPAGGNVAMIDGHTEWRRFDDMQCRSSGSTSTPGFWW